MQRGDEATRHPLVSINRLRILDALQDEGPLTLIELSGRMGLHVNTIRDHLAPLIDDGHIAVDSAPPRGRGRPRSRYRAIEGRQMRDHLRALRRLERLDRRAREGDQVDSATEPNLREAHQRALLDEHMDELGFEPSSHDDEPDAVRLVPCVAREIADSHDRVMCRVHERLIGELLTCVDGPLELDDLRPFNNEHGCVLLLRRNE